VQQPLPLEQKHKEAMLELILAWGALDTALGMLVSYTLGIPMVEGAEKIGKLPASAKLQKIYKILRDAPNGEEAAKTIKKYKNTYEKYSLLRKPIAHSKCIGVKSDDNNSIVFLAFEKHGENELAVGIISICQLEQAAQWGRELIKVIDKIVNI
jgi:hypothetical protein